MAGEVAIDLEISLLAFLTVCSTGKTMPSDPLGPFALRHLK
jgi:hypothetical protein